MIFFLRRKKVEMNKSKYESIERKLLPSGDYNKNPSYLSLVRRKTKGLWRVEKYETSGCCIEANALPRYEFVIRKTRVGFCLKVQAAVHVGLGGISPWDIYPLHASEEEKVLGSNFHSNEWGGNMLPHKLAFDSSRSQLAKSCPLL